MTVTRSASSPKNAAKLASPAKRQAQATPSTPSPRKRNQASTTTPSSTSKRQRTGTQNSPQANASPIKPLPHFDLVPASSDPGRVIPGTLSFSYSKAKAHLSAIDPRFKLIFETVPCRPFEPDHLESVDPFRSLCTSIIGQQVSWLAARSINHKFRRLFDPSLPEKAGDPSEGSTRDK